MNLFIVKKKNSSIDKLIFKYLFYPSLFLSLSLSLYIYRVLYIDDIADVDV